MKRFVILCIGALALIACNKGEQDLPLPPGTEGYTYELKNVEYDGLLATDNDDDIEEKIDEDVYWEAEAEPNGTFKNTISVEYNGNSATVTFNSKAKDIYRAEQKGAHVAILPINGVAEVKKCEIILSGKSDNGSLKVYCTLDPDDKEAGKKVKLTLNGLELKSQSGPAINYQAGKRMFLHLADGTVNTLEDAADYDDDICYFPGKTSADEDRDGCLFSEKAVVVSGKGKLVVKGNHKHAIAVDNDFYMRPGPTVVLASAAKACLNCNDNIHITGGYLYAANSSDGGKCLKTDGEITIDGGRLVLNTSGDDDFDGEDTSYAKAMSAELSITINGGDITARSTGKGALGFDSNDSFVQNGGKIDAITCGDAVKAATGVTFNGGEAYCLSTLGNAAVSDGAVRISGGIITCINADMENESAGVSYTIDGGEFIAIGKTVAEPSAQSRQNSIFYNSCPLSISEELSVKDETGAAIITFTSPLGSESAGVLLSSPKLTKGNKYSISIGSNVYYTVTI